MSKWMNARMFVTALIISFFAGTLMAADANKPMAKPPRERGQMKRDISQMRLNHLSETLNLDEKQKEQIKPILEEEMKQMRALRDEHLAPEQRAAKMQEIRKTTDTKIEQVLTPEQKEKFQKMREEQKARIESRRAARNEKLPPPDSNSKK